MPTRNEILAAIPSTEPATFGEFLNGLPDTPEKGDREEWAELFGWLRTFERMGWIEVERASKDGSIESLMVTALGVEEVRKGND